MRKNAYPGVSMYFDRHRKMRWRFRMKGKKPAALPGPYGSPKFIAAYEEAISGKLNIGAIRTIQGTIGALVVGYLESADYKLLSANTRRTYKYHLERLRRTNGAKQIRELTHESITHKLDTMADKPASANIFLKVIRAMCKFAVDRKMMKSNPAERVKRLKDRTDGIHTWTDSQISQFEAHYPVGTKENLALRLHLYTAQRRGDVVVMGRQHERNGSIVMRQQKTGAKLILPIVPALREAIDRSPVGDLTYLVTEFGKPFSNAGFGNWFAARCAAAGLKGCSAHGLRKAAARRMAESGKSAHEIMAITGHKSLNEVERYTRAANQEALAVRAADGLSGVNREPKSG